MKVAHIICTFPPYKGGMGQVTYHQAKELTRAGHEVVVFIVDYGRDMSRCVSKQRDAINGVSTAQKFNFKVIKLKPWLKFGNGAFLPQLLFRLRKFDVVQLHYPFFGAQEVVWLACKLGLIGGKLVIFYHMDFVTRNQEIKKSRNQFLLLFLKLTSLPSQIIFKSLLNSADKILVSSLDYAQEMKVSRYYRENQDKFEELPLGADRERIKNYELRVKNKDNKKIILFVGALDRAHYFKGVDVLLKVCYQLPITNYRLLIIGDGDLRSEYEKQTVELGLQNEVKFLGSLNDHELQDYYQLCDVLVLPSTTSSEAFGLVLVEAMAHSKPVIASDLPGVRTVCRDGVNGLLTKPGDVDDLAEKIKIILDNNNLAKQMGERGRRLVEEKYNWQKHGQKLDFIYQRLLQKR